MAAYQAPPSLGFSRQEHWSGLPFPSPMPESEVAQLCLTLSDPMDSSLPGSSVHGIFQARVLEWGAIAVFKYSWPLNNMSLNFRSTWIFFFSKNAAVLYDQQLGWIQVFGIMHTEVPTITHWFSTEQGLNPVLFSSWIGLDFLNQYLSLLYSFYII